MQTNRDPSENSLRKGFEFKIDAPSSYRIRVIGELKKVWSDRMGGMRISRQTQEDGSFMTTLEGELLDQAALFGVLVALYNLRLTLISVEMVNIQDEDSPMTKVKIEQKKDYLEFTVTGLEDALRSTEPIETVLNSCELAGIYRVLVDFRGLTGGNEKNFGVEYTHGTGQLYQKYLASGGAPLRIAVVGREDVVRIWKQNEEIARDYGMESLVTSVYEEAVDWLRSARNDT